LLEKAVYETADEYGVTDYILKQAMVSKTNAQLWDKKRNVDEPFDDAVEQMIDFIENKDWGFLGRG
jgi:hypothetical protein